MAPAEMEKETKQETGVDWRMYPSLSRFIFPLFLVTFSHGPLREHPRLRGNQKPLHQQLRTRPQAVYERYTHGHTHASTKPTRMSWQSTDPSSSTTPASPEFMDPSSSTTHTNRQGVHGPFILSHTYLREVHSPFILYHTYRPSRNQWNLHPQPHLTFRKSMNPSSSTTHTDLHGVHGLFTLNHIY